MCGGLSDNVIILVPACVVVFMTMQWLYHMHVWGIGDNVVVMVHACDVAFMAMWRSQRTNGKLHRTQLRCVLVVC